MLTPTLISLPLYTSGGRSGERARVIVDDRYDELPPQRVYSGRGVGGGYPYEGGGGGRGAVRYVEDEYYDDGYTEPVAPVRYECWRKCDTLMIAIAQ